MGIRRSLCHCIATGTLVAASFLLPFSGVHAEERSFDQSILRQVQTLYQLEEHQAIERLARESIAAETYQTIRTLGLKSYAGAWFDDKSMILQVAISDTSDSLFVTQAGATPVMVDHSLNQLERIRQFAYATLKGGEVVDVDFRESFIDYRRNQVIIGVAPGQRLQAQALFNARGLSTSEIDVFEQVHAAQFSSGPIQGGNGTQNHTWEEASGFQEEAPCSIGAAVEGGFVTAGHCGSQGNEISTPAGQTLGVVADSTWQSYGVFWYHEDGGLVQSEPGWYPTPWINGYNDGLLLVPALWAGVLESPVNTTVCRYGQISGGPYCGMISQKNVNDYVGSHLIMGMVKVGNACTDEGDSGGPFVSASGDQVQGTVVGGSPVDTCPIKSADVYYQPITTTLSRFGNGSDWLRMLTMHGAVKPTVNGFKCPDYNSSGQGIYVCNFSSYNSQGKTDISWSSSTGHSGQSNFFGGSCLSGQTVTVNLEVSNPYGTLSQPASFPCPMGPIQ